MKISEIIKTLESILETHGDLECWYSHDSEGNAHSPCEYLPQEAYLVEDSGVCYSLDEEEDVEYEPICVVN